MDENSRNTSTASPIFLGETWFDPIEMGIRDRICGFIEALVDEELNEALGRGRYQRPGRAAGETAREMVGYRHGRRKRQLLGSFGPVTISVPRARLTDGDGTSQEWHSDALPRYARMTKQVEALIAGAYLSGTNTRRVRRALGALFKGAVSKDTVSRTWRKVQTDWQVWCRRSLAEEDELRSGVGLVHSTDDAVEGNETRRGKGPAREEPTREGPGPDTEPGRPAIQPRTGERGGTRAAVQTRFTALLHHVDIEALERAFRRQKRQASAGVDGITVADYEQNLEANLQDSAHGYTPGATGHNQSGVSISRKPMADGVRLACRRGRHNAPHAACVWDEG